MSGLKRGSVAVVGVYLVRQLAFLAMIEKYAVRRLLHEV